MLDDMAIQELLHRSLCYVLYNEITLQPVSTSGEEFVNVPAGFKQAVIAYKDHQALMTGEKQLGSYFMLVDATGTAKFKELDFLILPKEFINLPDTIKDLDPKQQFFDYLGIRFIKDQDTLSINFVEDHLSSEVNQYFKYKINGSKMSFNLCVTEYGNPTALHEILKLDMSRFYNRRTVMYKLKDNYERISVWAIR